MISSAVTGVSSLSVQGLFEEKQMGQGRCRDVLVGAAADEAQARDNYLKVHFFYTFPEWEAPALFQAGKCEELIGTADSLEGARKWYQTLQKEFADSDFAKQAATRLKKLDATR